MLARHQTSPALGRWASRISTARSSTTERATSKRSRQGSHAAMCARNSSPGAPVAAHSRTSNSRPHSRLDMEQLRKLSARTEQERLDALAADAHDFGDLGMRRALAVREPENLALHRFQLRQRARQVGPLVGTGIDRVQLFRDLHVDAAALPAAAVAREIRGDAKERISPVRFVL